MATAADHNTLSHKDWIPLGVYLKQMLKGVLSAKRAKDLIRQELYGERLPYRYRDELSNHHENDLPNIFWQRAKIDFQTSSATTHPDPRAELALMVSGRMPKGIEIFNIEVMTDISTANEA